MRKSGFSIHHGSRVELKMGNDQRMVIKDGGQHMARVVFMQDE
jgi:hypothetical protein